MLFAHDAYNVHMLNKTKLRPVFVLLPPPPSRVAVCLTNGRGGGGECVYQCCQVDEILAKKLKKGRGKIKLAERIYSRILPKVAEMGPENIF
jgi:hypothetical protein